MEENIRKIMANSTVSIDLTKNILQPLKVQAMTSTQRRSIRTVDADPRSKSATHSAVLDCVVMMTASLTDSGAMMGKVSHAEKTKSVTKTLDYVGTR